MHKTAGKSAQCNNNCSNNNCSNNNCNYSHNNNCEKNCKLYKQAKVEPISL